MKDSDNELIRRIDAAVSEAKENEEWRRAYMTYWTRLQDERDEGREEGREEGLRQGRDEGKLEMLAGLVRDKILTIDQAASRRSLTVDDFKKQCVKYNLTL